MNDTGKDIRNFMIFFILGWTFLVVYSNFNLVFASEAYDNLARHEDAQKALFIHYYLIPRNQNFSEMGHRFYMEYVQTSYAQGKLDETMYEFVRDRNVYINFQIWYIEGHEGLLKSYVNTCKYLDYALNEFRLHGSPEQLIPNKNMVYEWPPRLPKSQ